jgi:hypothetical protein
MTTIEKLNFAGLLLSFIGGCMLFKWGPPQPDLSESVGFAFEENTVFTDGTSVKQMKADARALRVRHERLSRLALGLIVFGFLLQLGAVRPVCALVGWGCPA